MISCCVADAINSVMAEENVCLWPGCSCVYILYVKLLSHSRGYHTHTHFLILGFTGFHRQQRQAQRFLKNNNMNGAKYSKNTFWVWMSMFFDRWQLRMPFWCTPRVCTELNSSVIGVEGCFSYTNSKFSITLILFSNFVWCEGHIFKMHVML